MRAGFAAQRTVADAALTRADSTVLTAVRAAMQAVLDRCQAAVHGEALTAAGPVDPHAFDQIPAWWAAAVDEQVLPALAAVLATSARRLVVRGEKIPGTFELGQPAVEAYMAQVSNRLAGIGDDLWAGARAELAAGLQAGEPIEGLAARLERFFDWDAPTASARMRLADALAERDIAALHARRLAGAAGRLEEAEAVTARARLAAARSSVARARTAVEEAGRPYQVRARLIARTEVTSAYGAGQVAGAQVRADITGAQLEKVWIATIGDDRTRPDHADADGQQVPVDQPFTVGDEQLMHPGDTAASAEQVCNCVAISTRVEMPGLRAVMGRWYSGDVLRLRTASGSELTISPNHPVLRADGRWVPAGEIVEGDELIHARLRRHLPGQPDVGNPPAEIGQVEQLARLVADPQRVRLAPPDLHGDGTDGEVDVVAVHGGLRLNEETATDEQVVDLGFALADLAALSSGRADRSQVADASAEVAIARLPRSTRGVGGGSVGAMLLGRPGCGQEAVGLREPPRFDPCLMEPTADRRARYAELPSYLQDAFPSDVARDQVISVERQAGWHGRLLNLDTGHGWYIGEGLILANCRCSTAIVNAGEMLPSLDRQMAGGPP